jgi:hypothetical protein
MAPRTDIADLKARVPLAELIDMPLQPATERGVWKACCPFHKERTASFYVFPDGRFHCFGCGAHGDHLDWLMMGENLSFKEALKRLREIAGELAGKPTTPKADIPPKASTKGSTKNYPRAMAIWAEAVPITGTLAQKYLEETRRIPLEGIPTGALRFHPHCPFTPGRFHPCLIALFVDPVTSEPVSIHRTALTRDARKIDKMALAPCGGAVIKLWSDAEVTTKLVVGEGIETTLAASTMEHLGALLRPAWAAGSAPNMAKFPVLPGIKKLTLIVDNDANGEGQRAARECRQRWRTAERGVVYLITKQPDTDFNDVLLRKEC